jgi:hypothetical protein
MKHVAGARRAHPVGTSALYDAAARRRLGAEARLNGDARRLPRG